MPKKLIELAANVQTVNNGAAVALDESPLLGGQGREGLLRLPVLPLTSTVLIQGHPAMADKSTPLEASTDWTTLATLTSASDQVQRIADLPDWVRYRTSVLDADGPVVNVYLEGEQ